MYNSLKRLVIIILAAVLFVSVPETSSIAAAAESDSFLDESELANGIITVDYPVKESDAYVVRTIKEDSIYVYNYSDGIRIPLQGGKGTYKVQLLAPVGGQNYTLKAEQTVEYKNEDSKNLYLQSNIIVNWDSAKKTVKKAEELTADSTTDTEKVLAIYNYIVKNIKYDYKKAATVQNLYFSNADGTLEKKTGICYDYSVLFASMLRSVGVPAKVTMGTSKDITGYHAWNQVYIKETDKWITVDTTADAGQSISKNTLSAISKKISRYSTEKQY
ncbi:transglutaminase-like domain-containing protein [Anaerocolumna xylanovorans]|uniref:Transglutaminase-like superfamily protein n=1 Tax=Anaerocolumna xylanovorans DSM 12503 TaxID=1121345 RepID=A0A1M7Y7I6_9FIRM|nr:transglutaminase-like domain-containing protein [Anaerocolumna xylanovorans]SHO48496.1 Transglutaminase-like superfamily protein [Anaerocolumna xylanovorans DSM 12503]